ncbi:hypothetical protein FHQ18_03145 [Deferribacter autotrophicus]|uniref:Uncharacterized protein n=1 Tax=Deferribacter autotrophicus TaxID=500465 RepID=A0A5A8F6S0_9BACT|nr:hypothetical protein [Deferribacter autotrophicus]KAA0258959.1 hypothetical protein FHQ18_03145 [Deferribacter autotrophicus]
MNKRNIIVAVNSQLIKKIVFDHYHNENLIVLNSPNDIFNLGTINNAFLILENSFLNEIGTHYLFLLSENNKLSRNNVLLITSNIRTKTILSFTLSNIYIATPEEFISFLQRLDEGTLYFPTKEELITSAISREEIEKKLIKKFLSIYSEKILDNILDINNYFIELTDLIYTALDIKKLVLHFIIDEQHYIFTTINENEISQLINVPPDTKIFLTDETYKLEKNEQFYSELLNLTGKNIGEIFFIFDRYQDTHILYDSMPIILNILKKFYLNFKNLIYKEQLSKKNVDLNKLITVTNKIFTNKSPKNLSIISEKAHTYSINIDNKIYQISTLTTLYNHMLISLYLYHLINQNKNFDEICLELNNFIHQNLLHFYPTPVSLTLIYNNKLYYCATNDMILIDKLNKKIINCENPYFGIYKDIDFQKIVLYFADNLDYIQVPDYLLIPIQERNVFLERLLNA